MTDNKEGIISKKPFDIQEAAILLDVYLLEKSKNLKRTESAQIASDRLRDLAARRGMSVSHSFRSPMGLQNRLRSIGGLYEGNESTSAPGTDVFREAVTLYRDDRQKYQQILDKSGVFSQKAKEKKEKQQMGDVLKKAKENFFVWLPNAVPPHVLEEIKSSYKVVGSMLVQKKVLPQSMIETTQIDQIENALKEVKKVFGGKRLRNNATKLLTAYLLYLKGVKTMQPSLANVSESEDQEDRIRFDFTNAKLFKETYPAYCSVNGTVIEGKNWARILVAIVELEIANGNPALNALYEKPLYANKEDRPFLTESRIEGINCTKLSNGYWINVNWSIPRLMYIIQVFCLHCGYTKEQIVLYGVPKGNVSSKHGNTSPNSKQTVNRSFDMQNAEVYLRDAGLRGATVQELIDAIQPSAAFWKVKNALDKNLNVMAMPENRFIHVDSFVDLDEAEEYLGRILRTHFAQFGGYSNNQLLFGAASRELSMFLNDNDCNNIDAVYAIAKFLFGEKSAKGKAYKFNSPHIFEVKPDFPMNLRGLMIHFARSNGGILHAVDAKTYLQKTMLSYGGIGQLLQIGTSNTFLMYDSDRYLLSEAIGIDDAWCYRMHGRVDDLFHKANVAYVIPRDISAAWLSTLPDLPQNLEWTHLLFQEILNKYPAIGFKSISADINQSHHTLAAAFVPIDSPLQSFPDVVTLFMEERHVLPMRMPGEDLRLELKDAGMLEASEMIYALPKALNDYRFAWTDENKTVYIRGNK